MNTYKIKENLFLKGNKVISYDTHVATVKGKQLIERGKYSRTTGKHVSLVASLLGLELVSSKTSMKHRFDKYEYGVKCTVGDSISWKTTRKIFEMLKDGYTYEITLVVLKNSISKKDWELLDGTENLRENLIKSTSGLCKFGLFDE